MSMFPSSFKMKDRINAFLIKHDSIFILHVANSKITNDRNSVNSISKDFRIKQWKQIELLYNKLNESIEYKFLNEYLYFDIS